MTIGYEIQKTVAIVTRILDKFITDYQLNLLKI